MESRAKDGFTQCVHFDFYDLLWLEKGYTVANLFFLYGLPLAVIITCYSTISYIMIKRSKTPLGKSVSLTVIADPGELHFISSIFVEQTLPTLVT